jgi:uncharacterized protein
VRCFSIHNDEVRRRKIMQQSNEQSPKPKSRRGFAAMSPEKRAEIASKGGKAAHAVGKAHEFTSDEARVAGKKGGHVAASIPGRMREIGRLGGLARGRNAAARAAGVAV